MSIFFFASILLLSIQLIFKGFLSQSVSSHCLKMLLLISEITFFSINLLVNRYNQPQSFIYTQPTYYKITNKKKTANTFTAMMLRSNIFNNRHLHLQRIIIFA